MTLHEALGAWRRVGIELSGITLSQVVLVSGEAHLVGCSRLEERPVVARLRSCAELTVLRACTECLSSGSRLMRVEMYAAMAGGTPVTPSWFREGGEVELVRARARHLKSLLAEEGSGLERVGIQVLDLEEALEKVEDREPGVERSLLERAARDELTSLRSEARRFLEQRWEEALTSLVQDRVEAGQVRGAGEARDVVLGWQGAGDSLVVLRRHEVSEKEVLAEVALLGEEVFSDGVTLVTRLRREHVAVARRRHRWVTVHAELRPDESREVVATAVRLWQDGGAYEQLPDALEAARAL